MRYLVCRKLALLVAIVCIACAQLSGRVRQPKRVVQDRLGTSIRSSGTVILRAEGNGGNAVVTISTTRLVGECTWACPSCQPIREFGESSSAACQLVQRIAISVDGQSLFVPILAYAAMYQPDYAKVTPQGSEFELRILGSDAASAYTTQIYFDEAGVQHMVNTYECGIGEETHFLRFAENFSGHGAVRMPLTNRGETKIMLRTATHRVSANIQVTPFEGRCTALCPDTSNLLKGGAHGSILSVTIKLFIDGKPTPSQNSSLSGEGIRNASPLYSAVVDPHQVSLRAKGHRFVLRLDGGGGTTANFREFLFDSQGIRQLVVSDSPDAPVSVTDFYPAECE